MIAYERCPICKKPFEDCPHSVGDVAEWNEEQRFRRIVREEVRKALRPSLLGGPG